MYICPYCDHFPVYFLSVSAQKSMLRHFVILQPQKVMHKWSPTAKPPQLSHTHPHPHLCKAACVCVCVFCLCVLAGLMSHQQPYPGTSWRILHTDFYRHEWLANGNAKGKGKASWRKIHWEGADFAWLALAAEKGGGQVKWSQVNPKTISALWG